MNNLEFNASVSELEVFSSMFKSGPTNQIGHDFDLEDFNLFSKYNLNEPLSQLHPNVPNLKIDRSSLASELINGRVVDICERTLFTSLIANPYEKSDEYEFRLELPDLPTDMKSYSWQIPTQSNYEWINYENLFDINRKEPFKVFLK